ncbi:HNH endonuclease signature motif containing protein [Sphaerimonospora thailandensis]|uniref:HNH endonuclease signature motif containing protein n=1 Tax=Sphaerimonospora thailandensis TaxID=795644 RepID=UPI00194E654A|nr:HNH endonuclease signature motif containing protein [Sphaerimonospora thailandensis]
MSWSLVSQVREAALALALTPVPDSPQQCLAQVEELAFARDRLEAAIAVRAQRVHAAGAARERGHASTRTWLRSVCGMSRRTAYRTVALGVELARLPGVRARFATGNLTEAVVSAICAATTGLSDEDAAKAETILLELADSAGPEEIAKAGRYLRAVLDPDGEIKNADADYDSRFLLLRETGTGGVEGEFRLPREAAARLRAMLDAYAKPKAKGEDRPLRVRNADALIALLEQQITTELLVLINAESLPDDPSTDSTPPDEMDGTTPDGTSSEGTTSEGTDGTPSSESESESEGTTSDVTSPEGMTSEGSPDGPGGTASGSGASGDIPCGDNTSVGSAGESGTSDAAASDDRACGAGVSQDCDIDEGGGPRVPTVGDLPCPGDDLETLDFEDLSMPGTSPPDAAPADTGTGRHGPGTADQLADHSPIDAEPIDARGTGARGTGARGTGAERMGGGGTDAGGGGGRFADTGFEAGDWRWQSVLRTLPGLLLSTGQLLPITDIHRLARTSTLMRMVMNAEGQVLDMGRKVRLATSAQRRAVQARYDTCWVKGCPLPVGMCQVDHLDNWSEGGRTNLAKLGPACQFHNRDRYLHPDRYQRRKIGPDRWEFTYIGPSPTRKRRREPTPASA